MDKRSPWIFHYPVKVPAKCNFMNDLSLYQMEPMHCPAQSIQPAELREIINHCFKSLCFGGGL